MPAVRLALQAPTYGAVSADTYVQVPETWLGRVSAGAGLISDFRVKRFIPYVQAGGENARRVGGHIVVGTYAFTEQKTGFSVRERATVSWLSFQLPLTRWNTVHFHGGYALGHVKKQSNGSSTPYIDENRWVGLFGATLELHRPDPMAMHR
jgi:hypothetical protein